MTTKQEVELLKQQQSEINAKLNRILFLMEDDPTTQSVGFIARLTHIDTKINDILVREKVYKAKATVWGMVGASIISVVFFVVKQFLNSVVIA